MCARRKLQQSHESVIRDFTNQNATQFENTETENGPGQERRHEPREKQSYGCERDDRGRAKLR